MEDNIRKLRKSFFPEILNKDIIGKGSVKAFEAEDITSLGSFDDIVREGKLKFNGQISSYAEKFYYDFLKIQKMCGNIHMKNLKKQIKHRFRMSEDEEKKIKSINARRVNENRIAFKQLTSSTQTVNQMREKIVQKIDSGHFTESDRNLISYFDQWIKEQENKLAPWNNYFEFKAEPVSNIRSEKLKNLIYNRKKIENKNKIGSKSNDKIPSYVEKLYDNFLKIKENCKNIYVKDLKKINSKNTQSINENRIAFETLKSSIQNVIQMREEMAQRINDGRFAENNGELVHHLDQWIKEQKDKSILLKMYFMKYPISEIKIKKRDKQIYMKKKIEDKSIHRAYQWGGVQKHKPVSKIKKRNEATYTGKRIEDENIRASDLDSPYIPGKGNEYSKPGFNTVKNSEGRKLKNLKIEKRMWKIKNMKPYFDVRDVKQGGIGDCWLEATLKSMAFKSPDKLLEIFPNYLKEVSSMDGNLKESRITVRLYNYKERYGRYEPLETKDILVDATELTIYNAPSWNSGAVLWPHMIEKAADKLIEKFHYDKINERGKQINGGSMNQASVILLGKSARTSRVDCEGFVKATYSKKKNILEKTLNQLKDALEKSDSPTCATREDFGGKYGDRVEEKLELGRDPCNPKKKRTIWSQHVYTLKKIDENKRDIFKTKVCLINPWGVEESDSDYYEGIVGQNEITITLEEFVTYFEGICTIS